MKTRLIYPAIFSQAEDGITITFPDLPGCISCADTLEEAFYNAKEAMELYLEDYVVDLFKNVPKATELKHLQILDGQCIALIDLYIPEYLKTIHQQSVKKTLTIPMWMNEVGIAHQINFSKLLQEAIIKYIDENEL